MSTALYRRYRPQTFAEVIGQDHVTGPLKAALKANRVTHAYLFSGPRGCGKTTSARILARCLNCVEGPTDTPCGKCPSCVELATGGPGSLDVVEIDAASHNGVDDARELRERASFAPARDRYKVFILDEAHMVTPQGFNALLKLVEEPPEHVKFVFATTEPERVIGTIRSRTHHYPFRLVPADVLVPYLQSLCDAEQIRVGDGVLSLVVRAGGGSVRDSLSVLDQLMAGAQNGEITYELAVALLGYTDGVLLDNVVNHLRVGNGGAVFEALEKMIDSGHDPRRFVEDFLQRLRDLLIIALAPEGAQALLQGIPVEQAQRMYEQAQQWGAAGLSRAADLTDEALRSMVGATSPKLQVELLIGRILVETGGLAASAPVQHIPEGAAQTPPAASAPTPTVAPPAKPAISAPAPDPVPEPAPSQHLSYEPPPLTATIPLVPPTPVAPPTAVATSIPVAAQTPVAAQAETPAVEVPKLGDVWTEFTRNFLSEHANWGNVVASLKLYRENDTAVTFQLPTLERAETMRVPKNKDIVERVVEHTLGVAKTAEFVGPLVVEEQWEPVSEPVYTPPPLPTPVYEPTVAPVQPIAETPVVEIAVIESSIANVPEAPSVQVAPESPQATPADASEWEDETGGASLSDQDAGDAPEVGIPVVQKVFGAVVINEIPEGK